jgi:hypothetical protein
MYLVLSVFILLFLASTAFLYYQNMQLKNMLANYQTPVVLPTPSATADPTANWQTYTDSNRKFEFKYPTGWSILPANDEQVGKIQVMFKSPNNGGTMLRFMYGPTTKGGFEQIFNWGVAAKMGQKLTENKYLILTKLDEFDLSENKVLAYTANAIQPGMEETYYDYVVKADDNYYVFEFYYGNAKGQPIDITIEKPTFDQILSTFKFTK